MKFLLILIGFSRQCPPLFAQASITHNQPAVRQVTLVQLLASPQKYDGQHVQVTGYLNLAYEAHALYSQQDNVTSHRLKNGVWVDFSTSLSREKKLATYNQSYVVVVGTFNARSKGHLGLFGGALNNIISLDEQPVGK